MEESPSRGQKFSLEPGTKWYLCYVMAEDFGICTKEKLLGERVICCLRQPEMVYIERFGKPGDLITAVYT